MPTFELTPEQESMLFPELVKILCEGQGAIFAQIGLTGDSRVVCTAKHISQKESEMIKSILMGSE